VETNRGRSLDEESSNSHETYHTADNIPFMQLPARFPQSLKRLIPYQLARELRCVPVGRDHNRITVAMANPTDTHAINLLQNTISMAIFPVACEASALDAVLSKEW
jgi:type II secretory ATPase GspE/PulE/Tfp pilus assembly ATPase PilB-like protein